MKMSDGILTCRDKVSSILDRYPVTRDSDKLLFLAYLCENHSLKTKIGFLAYEELKKVIMDDKTPTMESISRARRKLQENGQHVGLNRESRMTESEVVREMMR